MPSAVASAETASPLLQVSKVAVIGAGISGVTSAAHLITQGLDVTVFERSHAAGGVWLYNDEVDKEPPYPSIVPPRPREAEDSTNGKAHVAVVENSDDEVLLQSHLAPPGPCYQGLRNNIPTPVMRSPLAPWPEGTPDYVDHEAVLEYIQLLTDSTGVTKHIQFNSSVETIRKQDGGRQGWVVTTKSLRADSTTSSPTLELKTWHFDAVLVASGHYSIPRIPDIPGLKEWKTEQPHNVLHAKSYRTPAIFKDKTVLLIGAGVSCLDIATQSTGVARKVYQSARGGFFDIPIEMMPPSMERVGPVTQLLAPSASPGHTKDQSSDPRGHAKLRDGRVLEEIDMVVLGTGYITSYPFLDAHLQQPDLPTHKADEHVIISADGYTTHNLHRDIFYIPDPTLAFVGVPYHGSAFSLYDFQGQIIARVWAGKARLPAHEDMRAEYKQRWDQVISALGSNSTSGSAASGVEPPHRFHSLAQKDLLFMQENLRWANEEAAKLGHEPMPELSEEWVAAYRGFVKHLESRGWRKSTGNGSSVGAADKVTGEDVPVDGNNSHLKVDLPTVAVNSSA